MRYGYIRVSSSGQARDGNGLEAQEEAVKAAGAEEVVQDVYTGATADRPGLQGLLARVQAGDSVIVVKIDRLARSVSDGCSVIQNLIDRGVSVQILNIGTIDGSPTGMLTLHVMLAFAEYERDLIKERLAAGRAVAKQRTDYREGRPPKYTQEQIQGALELLKGHSYNEVVRMTGISKATLVRARKTSVKI